MPMCELLSMSQVFSKQVVAAAGVADIDPWGRGARNCSCRRAPSERFSFFISTLDIVYHPELLLSFGGVFPCCSVSFVAGCSGQVASLLFSPGHNAPSPGFGRTPPHVTLYRFEAQALAVVRPWSRDRMNSSFPQAGLRHCSAKHLQKQATKEFHLH